MSPLFARRPGFFVLVLSMAFVACTELTGPWEPEEQPSNSLDVRARVEVEVSPSGTVDLLVGDTLSIRGVGASVGADLVFTTSDSLVVAVASGGQLSAISVGEARISAAPRGSTRFRVVLSVTVRSSGPSSVEIVRVSEAGEPGEGESEDVGRVSGRVNVQVRYVRGDALALRLRLEDEIACESVLDRSADRGAPRAERLFDCSFDSAAFDTITGTPFWMNGANPLVAELVGGGGRVLYSSVPRSVELENRSFLLTRIVETRAASDSAGRRWVAGDVTAEALPVLFEREGVTRSVSFAIRRPGGMERLGEASRFPFRQRISREALGVAEGVPFRILGSSRLADGSAGPAGESEDLRADHTPPAGGRIEARPWIGAQTEFRSLYVSGSAVDAGVGSIIHHFYAGSPRAAASTIVRTGQRVTRGSELAESGEGGYQLVHEICDVLGNCRIGDTFAFGVDLQPPTLVDLDPGRGGVNPQGGLRYAVTDERSGVTSEPLAVSVTALLPNEAAPLCGPRVEGMDLPGVWRAGACWPETVGATVPVPRQTEGYFLYRIEAVDRAGNRSAPVERRILIDRRPPTITHFTLPARFTPGEEFTASASVIDNVDLGALELLAVFRGPQGQPIALPQARVLLGSPNQGVLSRARTVTTRAPFIRTLTVPGPGGASTTMLLDSLRLSVTDAADFAATRSVAISPAAYGGNVSSTNPFAAGTTLVQQFGATRVCAARCISADARGTTATVRFTGPAGAAPLARVSLYLRAADGTVASVGAATVFSVTETGTQRTYTFSIPFTPQPGTEGRYSAFVVGVTPAGNALKTDEAVLEVFSR